MTDIVTTGGGVPDIGPESGTGLPADPRNSGANALDAFQRLKEVRAMGESPALAIMLDQTLFSQTTRIANAMSRAKGFVPAHCVGQPEVCFAIVVNSLVWQLNPFSVAQSTYQPVPGARVSYEGKLVHAIMEASGRLRPGGFKREYVGDWSKVQGKTVIRESTKKQDDNGNNKKYAAPGWAEKDEEGLKLIVTAHLKGEAEPRSVELELKQCWPRNSTLWATDPKTQIWYRAVRMFGNVAAPSLLMGVPFIGDEEEEDLKDVTPQGPRGLGGYASPRADAGEEDPRMRSEVELVEMFDLQGEAFMVVEAKLPEWCEEAADACRTPAEVDQLLENNPEASTEAMDCLNEAAAVRRAQLRPAPEARDTKEAPPPAADPVYSLETVNGDILLADMPAAGFLHALDDVSKKRHDLATLKNIETLTRLARDVGEGAMAGVAIRYRDEMMSQVGPRGARRR